MGQGAAPVTASHILFVCTGNTGRSVCAEILAKRLIAARGLRLTVSSRGMAIDPRNNRAEPHLATLLAARGIDIAAHRATALTAEDVRMADGILTMTASHSGSVLDRFPLARGKLMMLSEAARDTQQDVADAFGAPMAAYERLVARLEVLVAEALDKLAPNEPGRALP
jgi:protein-tyrosine phosphatase